MTSVTDPETMNVDELPGIWTPVQWDMSEDERLMELEEQATASLLQAVDVPEAILRMLLNETEIEQAFDPPPGYDPELQGDWDADLITFCFKRPIKLKKTEREQDYLLIEYDLQDSGKWLIEIRPEQISLERI